MQDDPKDWSEEASRMAEVYSRSALTISVPLCEDSSQGFLAERRKGFRQENGFHIIKHRGEKSKPRSSAWIHDYDYSYDQNGPWFLEDGWRFSNPFETLRCSWLERGWTYQEWLLSPRVLHIDSMTLWDCFGGYANELDRRYMGKPNLKRNPEGIEKRLGFPWTHVVDEFTRRKITREEDRLPAVAGLAVRHAQATGDTYVAGLWRENLHWWLLWEPWKYMQWNADPQPEPNPHAPSWSWASYGGRVECRAPSLMFETTASFVSVVCQYDPPGSFTTVQKAWIDIECGISAVTEQIVKKDGKALVKAADGCWRAEPDYGSKYPDDLIDRGKIHMLHLMDKKGGPSALVLQEHGWEDGLRCFQRMGLASLSLDGKNYKVMRLPELKYGPVHGDMRQIVRLV